ncbi:flagellar motor protein MotB [Amaricoccus tamworthensis]|uniref:flagellar motor protein MotB n=1 Tax=Amaricoccus tamworthensis TaxID=57002 RepID=UPI003C7E65A0
MAKDAATNITIIRRKKVVAGGHHGGAWKVAYADFVTAMMAFFLLMWLLNVSNEETKEGLADYFSPTVKIFDTSGGGDGPFEGSSMYAQEVLAKDLTGQEGDPEVLTELGNPDDTQWQKIEEELLGGSGDAIDADPMMDHVATRLTDEGLIIEIFDIEGSPLFEGTTARRNEILDRLVGMVGGVLSHTSNPVAISGHLAAGDVAGAELDPWMLSSDRAQIARQILVGNGVADARIRRVTGKADRAPVDADERSDRNRRLEIILLRSFEE